MQRVQPSRLARLRGVNAGHIAPAGVDVDAAAFAVALKNPDRRVNRQHAEPPFAIAQRRFRHLCAA